MEDKKRNPSTKAKQKYNEKAYDRLYPYVQHGKKAEYEKCAKNMGMTLNKFIETTLDEKVKSMICKEDATD